MQLNRIPMCPSMNNAYPSNKFGRRFKAKALVLWEKKFHAWCLSNLGLISQARQEFGVPVPGHVVEIHCDYYFKPESVLTKQLKPKKNDLTNREKHIHDSVSSAIGIDDSYFWVSSARKLFLPEGSDKEFVNVSLKWIIGPWKGVIAGYHWEMLPNRF